MTHLGQYRWLTMSARIGRTAPDSRNSTGTTQGFGRKSRAFGKGGELCPADFGVHPPAHAAIGAAHQFSRPTMPAQSTRRRATSSGCSTMFVA